MQKKKSIGKMVSKYLKQWVLRCPLKKKKKKERRRKKRREKR
jgi:hypothetical protein